MSTADIGLGILGTGRMAGWLANGLAQAEGVRLAAVASRTQTSADRFVAGLGSAGADVTPHPDRGRILDDPAVDLVHVATPSALHCADTLACLEAGKHVLCEKPFALNASEARRMVDAARANGRFLMEAMWTRFLPAVRELRRLLDDGVLGPARVLVAGGAFMPEPDPENYLFRPDLGGGVLLDAGVYLVSWASWLFGPPERVLACGRIGEHGVDVHDAVLLEHADGATAQLYVSLQAKRAPDVLIVGEHGSIHVHPPVFAPGGLTVNIAGQEPRRLDLPFDGNGYGFQVTEAARCIRAGQQESAVMPLEESIAIMQTLDAIRGQIGLTYPTEN